MRRLAGIPVLVVALGAGVVAQEIPVIEADLVAVEKRFEAMGPGDVALGTELVKALDALAERFKSSPAKGKPEWKALLERAMGLEKKIRARAAEAPPASEGTQRAKALLDEVEAGLAKLAAGDVPGANALVAKNNAAIELLAKATPNERRAALFAECARRAKELDGKIRARAAEKKSGAPASADGLDLDADPTGLPATDLHYWRQFVAIYGEAVAALRGGSLRDEGARAKGALGAVTSKDHRAVVRARELLAKYDARLAEARERARASADAQAAKDRKDAAEVEKLLTELDGYFARDFSARMEPPYDATNARRWVARLAEWSALREKGLAMIAKVKADYPRFAGADATRRVEAFFAKGLHERIARDVQATTGAVQGTAMSQDGPIAAVIVKGMSYLAPDAFPANLVEDEGWIGVALDEMRRACDAIEALRIVRVEHQKRALEADLDKAGKDLAALLAKYDGAATAAYEKVRMPQGQTSGKDHDTARATIVASGTAESALARLVVHRGPEAYERRRESTTEAGGGWIRIERWTERGQEMQCTAAERIGDDVRLVFYSLRFIASGHPDSPRGRWFVADRFEGRRIKPENVAK